MSVAALQAINRAITGVTSAPDGTATYPIPGQINASDLPLVMLFPTAYDLSAAARNEVESVQEYKGFVLVASDASGIGVQTTVADTWTILDAFKARYKTLIGTTEELADGSVVITYHTDGQKRITYRAKDWIGFEIQLRVWEPV